MMFYIPTSIWLFVLIIAVVSVVSGAMKKAGKPLPDDYGSDEENLSCLWNVSEDGLSMVTRAYKNEKTGVYVARVSCDDLDRKTWLKARTEAKLLEQIREQFRENYQQYKAIGKA